MSTLVRETTRRVPRARQARRSRGTVNCTFEPGRAESLGAADGSFDVQAEPAGQLADGEA